MLLSNSSASRRELGHVEVHCPPPVSGRSQAPPSGIWSFSTPPSGIWSFSSLEPPHPGIRCLTAVGEACAGCGGRKSKNLGRRTRTWNLEWWGLRALGLYKLFLVLLCTNQSSFYPPPLLLLHVYRAMYDPPPTPRLYAIHHTLLVMATVKGQASARRGIRIALQAWTSFIWGVG